MNEASLTKKLVKDLAEAMPGSVTIKTNDSVTLGIPDLVHTWARTSVWMEVKYRAPTCEVYETQKEMMRRLGKVGWAFWVEFINQNNQHLTIIRHYDFETVLWSGPGFDTWAVAQFVRERMLSGN
jgi:hypothetical protein